MVVLGVLFLVLGTTLTQAVSTTRTLRHQAAAYTAYSASIAVAHATTTNTTPLLYGVPTTPPQTSPHYFTISTPTPAVSARSYLLGDLTTGAIYTAKAPDAIRPIASISKLVTALVADTHISPDEQIYIHPSQPITATDYREIPPGATIAAPSTIYPLLMESNNAVAHALAEHNDTAEYISAMRSEATLLGMTSTSFNDASGLSPQNVSTAADLFKLAQYLYTTKPYVLDVTREPMYVLHTNYGDYTLYNHNHFTTRDGFIGGKTGYTDFAGQTMVALFDVNVAGVRTPIAVVVLDSDARERDVRALRDWFTAHATLQTVQNTTTLIGDTTLISGTLTAD